MTTQTYSSVSKITNNLAVLFPAGKLDKRNPETVSAAKEATAIISKLENLKSYGAVFASIEVSSYVKELVACKNNAPIELYTETEKRSAVS